MSTDKVNELANQPAFPFHSITSGMTLHQYYVGQAIIGLLSDPNVNGDIKAFASSAILIADALIEALSKTKQP